MNRLCWLVAGWLLATAALGAPPAHVVTVRSWAAPTATAGVAEARAALAEVPAGRVLAGESPAFFVHAGHTVWYALELPALAQPSVLELTHPSVRTADLYLADSGAEPAARSGRDRPAAERPHQRFPALLPLAASASPRTVVVKVRSPVNARGEILLHTRTQWEMLSRLELAGMALGFGVAGLAALYALAMALVRRSSASLVYALLTINIAVAGMFITGLGEAMVWPQLAHVRGEASAVLACTAAGLALLLAERALALEVSAPRFVPWLRVFAFAFALMGVLALPLPFTVQQWVAHFAAGAAVVSGLAALALAWRTANDACVWLLAGCVPMVIGAGLVSFGIAGGIPFSEWLLLALPIAGMLQIPFQLHGLRLLDARHADVRRSLAHLETVAGPEEESREEVATRLERLPAGLERHVDPRSTLMLLRFEGLAPGASGLRQLDAAQVERYVHGMMQAALRPGGRVGRWSFHELLLRDVHHAGGHEVSGLVTALFTQSLRSSRFGIPQELPRLRIAHVRSLAAQLPVRGLARALGRALDDPAERELRRIELEPWTD